MSDYTSSSSTGSVAMDDYLEQIFHLIDEKGYARAIDISEKLSISQASVTNMLLRLDQEKLVNHERYRGTILTNKGKKIAQAIVERHQILTEFLRLFDVSEETILKDVEGMEHHISSETLNILKKTNKLLKNNPDILNQLKQD